MCTLILLRRPAAEWPLLVAANRDEMRDRPWAAPARHWPQHPGIVAGLDRVAGGSWLGINERGVVAAMLNRAHSLGPAANKRSRGLLVLDALDRPDAGAAARLAAAIEASDYRPFNMVVADAGEAFWIRHDGAAVETHAVAEGLSLLTAHEINDKADGRIADSLPRFAAAPVPDPDHGDWHAWQQLLASRESGVGNTRSLNFALPTGFGTRSAALLALPRPGGGKGDGKEAARRPVFLFAAGPPDRVPWDSVELD